MPNDFGKYAIAITFLLATFYWAVQLTAGEYLYQLSFITAAILACIFIGIFTKDLAFTASWIPASLYGPLCMKYNAHIANGSSSSLAQVAEMKMIFWIVAIIVLIITIVLERRSFKSIFEKLTNKIGTTNLIFASIPVILILIACTAFTGISLMPIVFLVPFITSTRSFTAIPMLLATAGLCLAIAFNSIQLMILMLASIALTMITPPIYSTMKQKFN